MSTSLGDPFPALPSNHHLVSSNLHNQLPTRYQSSEHHFTPLRDYGNIWFYSENHGQPQWNTRLTSVFICEINECDSLSVSFTKAEICQSVKFTPTIVGLGSLTLEGYSWSFGDGNHSTEDSPKHVYQSVGAHYVTLTVSTKDAAGSCCQKSYKMEIMVTACSSCQFLTTAAGVKRTKPGDLYQYEPSIPHKSTYTYEWSFNFDGPWTDRV